GARQAAREDEADYRHGRRETVAGRSPKDDRTCCTSGATPGTWDSVPAGARKGGALTHRPPGPCVPQRIDLRLAQSVVTCSAAWLLAWAVSSTAASTIRSRGRKAGGCSQPQKRVLRSTRSG